MEMDKLAEIAEVAQKRQLLVISDEIYSLLVYDMQPACFACLPGMRTIPFCWADSRRLSP